jgi:hypothetical protein
MTERYAIPTADLVDRLGAAKARLAPLLEELKAMEAEVKARGVGRHEGLYYDATVSSYVRTTLDMDAARAKLGAKWCAKHSTETGVIKLDVRAKHTGTLNAKLVA